MKSNMKFSVIVPVYNAEGTIVRCVERMIVQEEADLEIVLVDDYSQDDSYAVCKELQQKYPRIVVCQTDGKGVSAARNTGLEKASGDIIGFCDSDDMFATGVFQTLEKAFSENTDVDVIAFGYYDSKYEDKLRIIRENAYTVSVKHTAMQMLERVLTDYRVLGSVANKMYRASFVDGIRFNTTLTHCEDMHYNVQCFSRAVESRCMILNRSFYHYIHNDHSATTCADRLFDNNGGFKYAAAFQAILDCCPNDQIRHLVQYKRSVIAMDTLRHFKLNAAQRTIVKAELRGGLTALLKTADKRGLGENLKWLIKRMLLIAAG